MSPSEISYLAGFFDGEGCVHFRALYPHTRVKKAQLATFLEARATFPERRLSAKTRRTRETCAQRIVLLRSEAVEASGIAKHT
jgi:hypothetical protein